MKYAILIYPGWARSRTVLEVTEEEGFFYVRSVAEFDDTNKTGLEDAKQFIRMKTLQHSVRENREV